MQQFIPTDESHPKRNIFQDMNDLAVTSNNGAYSRRKGGMPPNLAGPRYRTIAGNDRGTIKSVVNSPRDEMGFHSN